MDKQEREGIIKSGGTVRECVYCEEEFRVRLKTPFPWGNYLCVKCVKEHNTSWPLTKEKIDKLDAVGERVLKKHPEIKLMGDKLVDEHNINLGKKEKHKRQRLSPLDIYKKSKTYPYFWRRFKLWNKLGFYNKHNPFYNK